MKVLFDNCTNTIVYIAVVDYDEQTKYLSEPVVFSLEANKQCFYETTVSHFVGGFILDQYALMGKQIETIKQIIPDPYCNWYIKTWGIDINRYNSFPKPKPANIINEIVDNDSSQHLRNYVVKNLELYYKEYYGTLDIKEPCD